MRRIKPDLSAGWELINKKPPPARHEGGLDTEERNFSKQGKLGWWKLTEEEGGEICINIRDATTGGNSCTPKLYLVKSRKMEATNRVRCFYRTDNGTRNRELREGVWISTGTRGGEKRRENPKARKKRGLGVGV